MVKRNYDILSFISTLIWFILLCHSVICDEDTNKDLQESTKLVNVEGKVLLRQGMFVPANWRANSRVLLDYGKYIGFIK